MSDSKMVTPFGKKLRIMRVERNSTLREMAILLGVSSAYLSSVELGKRPVSDKLVEKIWLKFDLSYREKEDLFLLVSMSKPVLKIQLRNASENKRKFAIDFVDAFPDLSEETVWRLREVLEG